ncbi:hypothetical protein SMALA_1339 [Streptomyces malaysiensis subsp. malaysiensis]|nr:hypothetical protein SMALA_1339 [Streptomyces malaysiensis]
MEADQCLVWVLYRDHFGAYLDEDLREWFAQPAVSGPVVDLVPEGAAVPFVEKTAFQCLCG